MDNFKLTESKFYNVYLYEEGQLYLGRSCVVLKTNKPSLAALTSEEWLDFGNIVRIFESTIKKCFGANYFNWGCFLNDAYKIKPYKPHVHWHVRPRYRNEIVFNGRTFRDEAFGSQFLRKDKEIQLDYEFLQKIHEKLLPYFKELDSD